MLDDRRLDQKVRDDLRQIGLKQSLTGGASERDLMNLN